MRVPARNCALTKDFGIGQRASESLLRGRGAVSAHRAKSYSRFSILVLFLVVSPIRGVAQVGGHFQVGGDYNFMHTNAPPGECGCFSMNGGDGWAGWNFTDHLAVVAQVAVQHASNINATSADLTLTSFLAGPRVAFRPTHRFVPFAQAMFGGAHASGLLTPVPVTGLSGTANSFAFTAGGGLDFHLSQHFSIRAIEADYYFTRFDNGVNNRQNNLRIAAGILFRFGSK
jgi:outer membrane immunogenic protein